MNILAVSTYNTACGIADYCEQVKHAIEAVDPVHQVTPFTDLSPAGLLGPVVPQDFDILWLNYHAALHAAWDADAVRAAQKRGWKVAITYHDTYPENSDKCRALHAAADGFIVHEPVTDLPGAVLIRHGIPAAASPWHYTTRGPRYDPVDAGPMERCCFKAYDTQPVLGTVGFNFPWKNFDRVAEATGRLGWALAVLSNNATEEDARRWASSNPDILIVREFLPQALAIGYLAGCDATLFAYECANAGTSGAIRQGIAARKPVLAFPCRQFDDLRGAEEELGFNVITWLTRGWHDLPEALSTVSIGRVHPAVMALAHTDGWPQQARKYLAVFEAAREVEG